MTDTYDSQQSAQIYDSARALPPETLALWMSRLIESVPSARVSRVLDLGGGTGRFAPSIQDTYRCGVIVLDPSGPMLRAGKACRDFGIEWVTGSAEGLPLSHSSVDLVWMSQAYHHLDDRTAAFREVNRVLAPSGHLVVRNGTRESDAELEWTGCFPEAQKLGQMKIPYRGELIESVCRHGFKIDRITRVYQMFARSWEEHYEKISRRGLSGLISMSDEAFAAGLDRLRGWVLSKPKNEPVFEPLDMFVFRKTRDAGPGAISHLRMGL